jgi:hypothetical protein
MLLRRKKIENAPNEFCSIVVTLVRPSQDSLRASSGTASRLPREVQKGLGPVFFHGDARKMQISVRRASLRKPKNLGTGWRTWQ